jgi:LDH2 family malate/lactate/ureidoglycolate dehydrogenase
VTPVVAHIDGQNGFGYLAAKIAMEAAIKSAEIYGIGMASVAHSNHFGMSAWVVQQAIDANMMSLVFTNSSPTMTVWGGASKRLGGVSSTSQSSELLLNRSPVSNCLWGPRERSPVHS